jgi:hypothetical protein
MKSIIYKPGIVIAAAVALLATACSGGRFVSADRDLEEVYVGKSYYDIVADFGRPDATMQDGMEGSKIAYNSVTLSGTKAAGLYRQYTMRNRATKIEGTPHGGITFSFDASMKCYAVDSDFERERTKEAPAVKEVAQTDVRMPDKVKPRIPRSIEYPYLDRKSPFAETVSIEQVDVERTKTTVYFMYRNRTPEKRPIVDDGLFIMPEVYMVDCATGKRYSMTGHEGIALYPERTRFANNQGGYDVLHYSLTFEALPENVEYIDIVEPGHSGYNFCRVDIRTPMSTKEELNKQ